MQHFHPSENNSRPAWWHMPVIPALERLRQEDRKFKASLSQKQKILVFTFLLTTLSLSQF
jgi:hypothetical protein